MFQIKLVEKSPLYEEQKAHMTKLFQLWSI